MVKKVLSINYSDTSEENGIQDDLRVFQEENVFGFTTITALHVVNKMQTIVEKIPLHVLKEQLDTVFLGGKMDAIKIGGINSSEEASLIISCISNFPHTATILELSSNDSLSGKYDVLFPIATLIILNDEPTSIKEAKEHAKLLNHHINKNFLVPIQSDKGNYLFYNGQHFTCFEHEKKNISAFVTAKKARNEKLPF